MLPEKMINLCKCFIIPSDIWILVEKRNDLLSIEMYEMFEKTNQEVEARYELQQAYISSRRFLRYCGTVPPETALRRANGEINETIIAGRIRII